MTSEVLPTDKMGRSAAERTARRKIRLMDWAMIASLAVILGIFIYTSIFTKEFSVDVTSVVHEYPYRAYSRYSAAGSVIAKRKVDVAAKVAGQLVEFMVQEGSLVTKGQVIARLESADALALRDQAEARLKMALANLEQARVDLAEESFNLERYKKLFQMGSVSRSEYKSAEAKHRKVKTAVDAAEASVKAEAAELKSAEVTLDYTQVRAPFAGVVLSLNAEVGDVVTPLGPAGSTDSSLATIVDPSSFMVEVGVPEPSLERVQKGQPCVMVFDGLPDSCYEGEVGSVDSPAERENRESLVRVRIIGYDPSIRPGMSAQIFFLSKPLSPGDDVARMMVHASAIVTAEDGPAVYLIKDGRAVLKRVRTGERFGEQVEILTGLSAGDMLVANPPDGLKNGSRLIVGL